MAPRTKRSAPDSATGVFLGDDVVEAALHDLTDTDCRVIELISILHSSSTATMVCNGLRKLRIRDDQRRFFVTSTLYPVLDRLEKRGLLIPGYAPICPARLVDAVTRSAQRAGTFDRMAAVVEELRENDRGRRYFEDAVSLIRLQLFRRDAAAFWKTWARVVETFPEVVESPSAVLFGQAFDPAWFKTLPAEIGDPILPVLADHAMAFLAPMPQLFELLEASAAEVIGSGDSEGSIACQMLAEYRLLRGQLAELDALVEGWYSPSGYAIRGASKMLQGDHEAAIALYDKGLTELRKVRRKRKVFFAGHTGLFHIAALLETGDANRYQDAFSHLTVALTDRSHPMRAACEILQDAVRPFAHAFHGIDDEALGSRLGIYCGGLSSDPLSLRWGFVPVLWLGLACRWHGVKKNWNAMDRELAPIAERAARGGYQWVAATAEELMSAGKRPARPREVYQFRSLSGVIKKRAAWRRTLDALSKAVRLAAGTLDGSATPQGQTSRLAWRVELRGTSPVVAPVEQRRNAKGIWGKGRPIALERLYHNSKTLDWLTPQDRAVCARIERRIVHEGYGERYARESYHLDGAEACRALRGHPLVSLTSAPGERLEIVTGEPEVKVSARDGSYHIEMLPHGSDSVVVTHDGHNRLVIVEFNPTQQVLRSALGQRTRATIPATGKTELAAVLAAISPHIRIQSDLIPGADGGTKAVPANTRPTVRLSSTDHGLHVELVVHPFAGDGTIRGPSYRLGAGGANVVADVRGARLSTVRDLAAEAKAREGLWARLPALAALPESADRKSADSSRQDTWVMPRDAGLDLMRDLEVAGDAAFVEWPGGDPWRVRESLALGAAKLHIRTRRDTFLVTGEVTLDDSDTVTVSSLLDLLADSPQKYVQLADGSFVALSDEFRERLEDLRAYGQSTDKGLALPRLAALTLDDIASGAGGLRGDKKWREHVARLRRGPETEDVPATLETELRDYQLDGYRWLCKLAHWGVGACLADDMGLGKTIQALALLARRASGGPALVVAPTSVIPNWIEEARRFAPTLRPIVYHGKNRRGLLDDLGHHDVALCSYAILQRDDKALAKISWHTLIIDEAQALKNRATKRWRAARRLDAACRVMLTGTPVENRVTELWSLFAILAPGLLGSPDRFAELYATPIEKHGDREAGARLRRLIKPFVLRRTKSQVLQQLPPRTDLVLHVELSPREAALYETIRKQALERISGAGQTASARRMQIFAELTRLRRACCSPALVLPDAPAASAKLEVFRTLVEDLLGNGHRALVFSQFVDHLTILRDALDAAGHSYQYLDGATPMKRRKQRIAAFQAGESDLFLISLKAGGVGINLTGADYVVHMDPWWNPATEDQASDRVHRIGQRRPVTVYRVVARDTIEERILALHRRKRALAEGILQGTAESGALSAEMLLELIKGQR